MTWSREDDAALLGGGLPLAELAAFLGRSTRAVRDRKRKLGRARAYRFWSQEELSLLVSWGRGQSELAARLGRSVSVISRKRRELGLPRLSTLAEGELSEAERAALWLYSAAEIMARYSWPQSTAYEVLRRSREAARARGPTLQRRP